MVEKVKKLFAVGTIIISTNLYCSTSIELDTKVKRGEKTTLLVVLDSIHLNHPKNSDLFEKNYNQYFHSFSKKALRSLKIKTIDYFVLSSSMQLMESIKHRCQTNW